MRRFERRTEEGDFQPIEPIPWMQFVWSLPAINTLTPQVVDEKRVDFGHLSENETGPVWEPELFPQVNACDCTVRPGQAARYHLRIEGDNVIDTGDWVLEVEYDGGWSSEREQLAKILRVTLVSGGRSEGGIKKRLSAFWHTLKSTGDIVEAGRKLRKVDTDQ